MITRSLFCVLFIVSLVGCSEPVQQSVPLYKVQNQPFDIVISGFGELEAARAESILVPGRRPMVLDWLAEENSLVKKGDVVARFDAEQLSLSARREQLAMMKLDKDMRRTQAERNKEQHDLSSEESFVAKEFDFVDAFAIDDLRLYSQLEIIDTLSNRDYLSSKDEYIDWKQGSITKQSDSAMQVLDIQKQGHQAKFQQHQEALQQLEVLAPYDGTLLYEKNWRNEKPAIGQTVFPGATIAKIPDMEKLQARVFVLDKDAIGLEKGQPAQVRLEAYPDKIFNGELTSVSGFSRTIKRGNPIKYFELVIGLSSNEPLLQPGLKVNAEVHAASFGERLLIPLQAIFNQQGENFVYLQQGQTFVRQPITTARKNLYFVEVTEGLEPGDNIALSVPELL